MKKNHKNKFKTPEGYFDSFNERLMDKIEMESSSIPKEDGFGVPEGYFTSFDGKLSTKLEEKEPRVIQLKSYRKYYFAAASIAAIIVSGFWFTQTNTEQLNFEDLATAELDAYFEKGNLDLNSYEIAAIINLENVSVLDITEANNTEENDMILEYLGETLDEIEDLNLDYDEIE